MAGKRTWNPLTGQSYSENYTPRQQRSTSPMKIVALAFILMLVFILVAYYVGVKSDATALGTGALNLVQVLQGRNPATGAATAYPK
jgi:hypothetical protein